MTLSRGQTGFAKPTGRIDRPRSSLLVGQGRSRFPEPSQVWSLLASNDKHQPSIHILEGWPLAGLAAQICPAASTCDPISCESEGDTLPPPPKVIAADLTGGTDAPDRPTSACSVLAQRQMGGNDEHIVTPTHRP